MIDLLSGKLGSIYDTRSGIHCNSKTLSKNINQKYQALLSYEINEKSKVVITHGNSCEFFEDILSIWMTSACACCLNEELTDTELENICDYVKPDLLLLGGSRDKPRAIIDTLAINLSEQLTDKSKASAPLLTNPSLDNPALVLFTSGTTGTPKGVVHTYRSIMARIALNQIHIPKSERMITFCPLPTHFGHGLIGNSLTTLLDGGDLILGPGGEIAAQGKLGEFIDEYKISFMSSVPSIWKMAIANKEPLNKTLKRVHVGSAPLSADLWKKIIKWSGTRNVINMYGITETANWISGASAVDFEPEDGLIGKMWGGEFAVRTEDGKINGTGNGEIIIQSPTLMTGYLNQPELTREVLLQGWFCTGDIGTIGEDGVARLTGRKKNQINRAGLKVYPEDIDLLLERHESVKEACAFGLPDEIAGELIGVAITPINSKKFDLNIIKEWCNARLTKEKIPDRWFIVDSIPKTDRGKINRENVAKFCSKQVVVNREKNVNKAEKIICEVIGLDINDLPESAAMGSTQNWDSLAMVNMIIRTEKLLGRRLSMGEILSAQSYLGLESVIEGTTINTGFNKDELPIHDKLIESLRIAGLGNYLVTQLMVSYTYCQSIGIKNPQIFIERLIEKLPEKSNIIIATFTWEFSQSGRYHYKESATELGIINELFRRREDIVRSEHPLYSYAAYGPNSDELTSQETNDSLGEGSVVRKLIFRDDVRVISVGLGEVRGSRLVANTGLHSLEQIFNVPYRYLKSFDGQVDFGEGFKPYTATFNVRRVNECSASSWAPADKLLTKRNLVFTNPDQGIYAYDNKDLYEAGSELLKKDINIFKIP